MAKSQPTLHDLLARFGSEEACIRHFARIRWPKGLECIRCDSKRVFEFDTTGKTGKPRHLYECVDCRYQYSVTTGTVFHDSHMPLTKWFLVIYFICSAKKGVSAKFLQGQLGVSYKTAWYMAHRVRLAMKEDDQFCLKFRGVVEADETYVGGRRRGKFGRAPSNKVPVVGIRERTSGRIRMQAVRDCSAETLADFIREHAEAGTEVHTDEWSGYLWLDSSEFAHKSVKHAETYVSTEGVHTNGVENVWSLFKRAVMGVFHKVSAKYLPLYLDEFAFRFNNRGEFDIMDHVLQASF